METVVWFIIFLVMVVFEIITLGLTTIWFALGALVAFIMSLCGTNLVAEIVVFVIISLLTLLITRPIARRYINNNTVKTNVDDMAGKTARVTEDIDNVNASGQIMVDGLEWTARSTNNVRILKDTLVRVERIEGVKAMVSPITDGSANSAEVEE